MPCHSRINSKLFLFAFHGLFFFHSSCFFKGLMLIFCVLFAFCFVGFCFKFCVWCSRVVFIVECCIDKCCFFFFCWLSAPLAKLCSFVFVCLLYVQWRVLIEQACIIVAAGLTISKRQITWDLGKFDTFSEMPLGIQWKIGCFWQKKLYCSRNDDRNQQSKRPSIF